VQSLNERFSTVVSDTTPTTGDIPDGEHRVWKNTSDSTVKLYANDGGVLVETTLS
jgi:hypothetical protein